MSTTSDRLTDIDALLQLVEELARELRADPENHVLRSSSELRQAFTLRGSVEPAVARVQDSLRMLWSTNRAGARREFQRRSAGLDRLENVVVDQLLPHLRGVGFNV